MNCVSSLSLPAPSQLVLICTSEMGGRYLSSGKRTGAELTHHAGRSAARTPKQPS